MSASKFQQCNELAAFFQQKLGAKQLHFRRDVWPEFAIALLTDPQLGPGAQPEPEYQTVVRLFQQWLATGKTPDALSSADQSFKNIWGVAKMASCAAQQDVRELTVTAAFYAAKASKGNQACTPEDTAVVLQRQYQVLKSLAQPLAPSVEVEL